ncbi:MAG: hypothetical protein ACRDUX_38470 [Mycobacterium sp.]
MSSSSGRLAVGGLLAVVALLFTSACENNPAPSPATTSTATLPARQFPNWPPVANEFRFQWSAAPGIDLAAGPAVTLRAYVESYRLSGFAGGDQSVVYPGFIRATPESTGPLTESGSLLQLRNVRPRTRADLEAEGWTYAERQVYGYQPTHILNLQPQGDGYRATVCLGLYSVYRTADNDPRKYFSTIADPDTGKFGYAGTQLVEIWRVELTDRDPRVANAPASPTIPQIGPLPAPTEDVFGHWFITGRSSGLWGPLGQDENIDTPEVRQQCEDAMPDDAAARMAMATGFHTQPPPHGNPIPGWPVQAK